MVKSVPDVAVWSCAIRLYNRYIVKRGIFTTYTYGWLLGLHYHVQCWSHIRISLQLITAQITTDSVRVTFMIVDQALDYKAYLLPLW